MNMDNITSNLGSMKLNNIRVLLLKLLRFICICDHVLLKSFQVSDVLLIALLISCLILTHLGHIKTLSVVLDGFY